MSPCLESKANHNSFYNSYMSENIIKIGDFPNFVSKMAGFCYTL